jgi:sortase B
MSRATDTRPTGARAVSTRATGARPTRSRSKRLRRSDPRTATTLPKWSAAPESTSADLAGATDAVDAAGATAAATGTAASRTRFRLSLILGIVFIVIALVIAVFLVYKYVNANLRNEAAWEASGLNKEIAGGLVAPDVNFNDLVINWDALKAINPDIVAWVMIPDTRINYPIVQTFDNDYYLNHLFDKTASDAGAIFLDSENEPTLTGLNNLIYGHNLIDGSMFAGLKSYQEREFFDAHKTVFLATPERDYRLEVRAALVCDADDKIRRFDFVDQEDYASYVRMLLGYAVINDLTDDEIPENIYCLATCTNIDYSKRTVILASVSEMKETQKGSQA